MHRASPPAPFMGRRSVARRLHLRAIPAHTPSRLSIETRYYLLGILALACLFLSPAAAAAQDNPPHGLDDWVVPDGFALSVDATGFQFPTAIAFIPQPGPNPSDPAYFVAEIPGTIKVVTNDRNVYTFANDFSSLGNGEEFNPYSGTGMAGLCLDPKHGYVFATYTAADEEGVLRNHIVRFAAAPQTFALQPDAVIDLSGLIADYPVTGNHQIGDCRVQDDHVFVGVGDGLVSSTSRSPNYLLGKVLRLTLDGAPAPDNPFYDPQNPDAPAGYIYAQGFRNPFGIEFAGDSLFVADNGIDIDRLVQVESGHDYLWDGGDWSIGAAANAILAPSIGVTHLAFVAPASSPLPSEFEDSFFVGTSGELGKAAAVVRLPYDFAADALRETPTFFVLYQPDTTQYVVALAMGPDGLYFAPLVPGADGNSAIYRVDDNPASAQAGRVEEGLGAEQLMINAGCLSCHSMNPDEERRGPTLDSKILLADIAARLDSPAYRRQVALLDEREDEPFVSYRQARVEVMAASGDERARKWIAFRLQEPRFDDSNATMPSLNLSPIEAMTLAAHLVQPPPPTSEQLIYRVLANIVPEMRYRHLLVFFGAGLVVGLFVAAVLGIIVLVWRRLRA